MFFFLSVLEQAAAPIYLFNLETKYKTIIFIPVGNKLMSYFGMFVDKGTKVIGQNYFTNLYEKFL